MKYTKKNQTQNFNYQLIHDKTPRRQKLKSKNMLSQLKIYTQN